MISLIKFFLGAVFGGVIGILCMACMIAASNADAHINQERGKEENGTDNAGH